MTTSNSSFEALKGYVDTHGTFPTPYGMYDDQPVGQWLKSLADSTSQETSDDDVISFLKQKNWDWKVPVITEQFGTVLELLRVFVAQYGRLPKQRETFEGKNLGIWVDCKRVAYKRGKLSATQIKLLNETRKWTWGVVSKTMRELRQIFVECYEKHGDIMVKHVGSDAYKRLQRMKINYMNTYVSAQHSAKLEQWPGWIDWCSKHKSRLSKKFEWVDTFKQWYEMYGCIPAEYKKHPRYGPIYRAKYNYNNGSLSQNARTTLEKTPGWVEFCSTKSNVRRFDKLEWVEAFMENHAKYGEIRIEELSAPHRRKILKTRNIYLTGKYSDKRVAELEELPGWIEWCVTVPL